MLRRLTLPLIVAGAALLAACGSATEAGSALGTRYDLVSVDGQLLPFTFPAGITGQAMTGARLEVHSRGRLLDIRAYASRDAAGNVETETDTAVYAYRLADSTLLVLHPAFDPAGAYSDTGAIRPDGALALQVLQRVPDMAGNNGTIYYTFVYLRSP